jgi:hypothetical protein
MLSDMTKYGTSKAIRPSLTDQVRMIRRRLGIPNDARSAIQRTDDIQVSGSIARSARDVQEGRFSSCAPRSGNSLEARKRDIFKSYTLSHFHKVDVRDLQRRAVARAESGELNTLGSAA